MFSFCKNVVLLMIWLCSNDAYKGIKTQVINSSSPALRQFSAILGKMQWFAGEGVTLPLLTWCRSLCGSQ